MYELIYLFTFSICLSNNFIDMINYIRFFFKKVKTIKYEKIHKNYCRIKIII